MSASKARPTSELARTEVLTLPEVATFLERVAPAGMGAVKPGERKGVLAHFGVFKEDGDLEAQLAEVRARREAVGK